MSHICDTQGCSILDISNNRVKLCSLGVNFKNKNIERNNWEVLHLSGKPCTTWPISWHFITLRLSLRKSLISVWPLDALGAAAALACWLLWRAVRSQRCVWCVSSALRRSLMTRPWQSHQTLLRQQHTWFIHTRCGTRANPASFSEL